MIRHRYDRDGREIGLTHPAQLAPQPPAVGSPRDSIVYTYDAAGQLSTVTDLLGHEFQFSYDARGDEVGLTMPGGISESAAYDADDRLVRSIVLNGSSSANKYQADSLRNDSLTYDAMARVLSSANTQGLQDTIISAYSGLGHLTRREYRMPAQTAFGNPARIENVERFALDALGNRFTSFDTTQGVSSNGSQLLVSPQTLSYAPSGGAPTGRLTEIVTPERRDSTLYDAAGNADFVFTWAYQDPNIGPTGVEDRASFYGGDNVLRAVEDRRATTSTQSPWLDWEGSFEEYRYDALGRRVMARTRRFCRYWMDNSWCAYGTLRRIVWDGEQVLDEIQMPGADGEATWWNNDTAHVHHKYFDFPEYVDPNPQYGRVAYTPAGGLDTPLALTRINYVDSTYNTPAGFHDYPAFDVIPHWDWKGQAELGTVDDGGAVSCYPGESARCVAPSWQWPTFAFVQSGGNTTTGRGWYGGSLPGQQDASGLLYRRNRYVDPATGRFTQEDPIGLAGGLNLYGFAGGDPVNATDPFGLKECWRWSDPKSADCVAAKKNIESCESGGPRKYAETEAPLEFRIITGPEGRGLTKAVELLADEGRAGMTMIRQARNLRGLLMHVTPSDLRGAASELRGLASGGEHLQEVREAVGGLREFIDDMNQALSNPELSGLQRFAYSRFLGMASRALDDAEAALTRIPK